MNNNTERADDNCSRGRLLLYCIGFRFSPWRLLQWRIVDILRWHQAVSCTLVWHVHLNPSSFFLSNLGQKYFSLLFQILSRSGLNFVFYCISQYFEDWTWYPSVVKSLEDLEVIGFFIIKTKYKRFPDYIQFEKYEILVKILPTTDYVNCSFYQEISLEKISHLPFTFNWIEKTIDFGYRGLVTDIWVPRPEHFMPFRKEISKIPRNEIQVVYVKWYLFEVDGPPQVGHSACFSWRDLHLTKYYMS